MMMITNLIILESEDDVWLRCCSCYWCGRGEVQCIVAIVAEVQRTNQSGGT